MVASSAQPGDLATRPRTRRTLEAALSDQNNALNTIRLGLALIVILGHAFPLGGFEPVIIGPFAHSGLHGPAVDAFFIISGYLILSSGIRSSTAGFLWRRLLRIYPAWLVAITATAFVAAPLGALIEPGASWDWRSATTYVVGALDLKPSQDGVGHTLFSTPWETTWNGSLWTLFYEAVAYIGVCLLCALAPVRDHLRWIVLPAAGIATALFVALPSGVLPALLGGTIGGIAETGLRLWTFFAWGMAAFILRDRLRPSPAVAITSSVIVAVTLHLAALPHALSTAILLPAMTAAVLYAGALLPWRLGSVNDVSYGVYVYAFPVQQLLVLLGVHQFGWAVTALSCVVVTLPLAWLSWHYIEQPALTLKGIVPARRSRPDPRA